MSAVKNTDRVKVACINWSHGGAPKATVYILSDGIAKVNTHHETWEEAIQRGNYLAGLLYASRVAETAQA